MIALPPFDGAVHDTEACPFPAVAVGAAGAYGLVAPAGVTAADAADGGPVPIAFVALTVNVYAVPLVSPVTVALVGAGLPETTVGVCAADPMNGVTV